MFKVKEWHTNSYPALCFKVANTYDDDCGGREPSCDLNIHVWKLSLWLKIPQIFKPRERWVDLSRHDWAIKQGGVKGYTERIRREYGFSFLEDSIHIHYGIQPGSWNRDDPKNSDHTKVFWYPWQLEHVRHEILDLQQNIVYSEKEWDALEEPKYNKPRKDAFYHIPDARCVTFFLFHDRVNHCTVEAKCHIEEREWQRGLWPWLRAITRQFKWGRSVQRTLDVEFKEEVGERKGSWKGGTVGCGMRMLPGETARDAIKRFQETWE